MTTILPDHDEKMGGRSGTYDGERRGAYSDWVGKPEGKRSLARRTSKWGDNIKMHLQEIRWRHRLD